MKSRLVMAPKRKRLTPATRPMNKLGRRGECWWCCEKHLCSREAKECYYFEDAFYGFDKDWNCLSEKMPKDFKKFSPNEESGTVASFLKLGHLCDKLVKYIEFHTDHDTNNAFGINNKGELQDRTTEFIVKVTSIAAKATQKAKNALEARPKLPKRIRDKMSILDNPFVDGYDIKVITKIAEFENHSVEDLNMLRCTYSSLAGFYSSLKNLCHYTYCHDHGRGQKRSYENDCQAVFEFEKEIDGFELAEYWQ